MLNRAAVAVRPKQPYLDWAEQLDGSGVLPEVDGEATIYLIPNYDTEEDAWEMLEDLYEDIFENELFAWHTDESAWPDERSFDLFRAWFDLEFHSAVEDLCDDPIEDDDGDEDAEDGRGESEEDDEDERK